MVYLYCLLRAASDPPAGLAGVDDTPVRAIDLGGLGAWVSDVSGATMVASPARARSHDRVVRRALERETPLPARFGQVVADVAALTEMVASRRATLESALEAVAGSVEMTVRVLLPPDGESVAPRQAATRAGRDHRSRLSGAGSRGPTAGTKPAG